MGAGAEVVRMMGTRALLRKMSGSLCDRGFVLEGCESMTRRLRWPLLREGCLAVVTEVSGVEALVSVLKMWMEDEPVAISAMRALVAIARQSDVEADRLVECDGVGLAERCKVFHADDREVQVAANRLMGVLTQRSSGVAEREIRICRECATYGVDLAGAYQLRRVVEDDKRQRIKVLIERATQRRDRNMASLVKTVLQHMKKHKSFSKVQSGGLDALVELARAGDDDTPFLDCAEAVVSAMQKHLKNKEVQWKASLLIITLAAKASLASDLSKRGAPKALKNTFDHFTKDREVRQFAIWALGALAATDENAENRLRHDHVYKCVVDAKQRLEPDQLVAVPLSLQNLWSDTDLEQLTAESTKRHKNKTKTVLLKKDDTSATIINKRTSQAHHTLANKGNKFRRVSADFTSGETGLLDSS